MSVDTALQIVSQTTTWVSPNIYHGVSFFLGCMTAAAELFSRYSDGASRIFRIKESYFYLALNGIASLGAYIIVKQHGLSFGPLGNTPLSQAVLAGFSAMAIIRSSVASLKIGQTTIQAGLAPVIQVFLNTVDRAFDRKRSQMAIIEVREIMKDVDFSKAAKDLPTTCINLMHNVSKEESEKMGIEVADLTKGELNPQAKAINLGIAISRVTGIDLLRSAVESLGDVIYTNAQLPDASRQKQPLNSQEERIKELKKRFL